jgi:hypothetical protein
MTSKSKVVTVASKRRHRQPRMEKGKHNSQLWHEKANMNAYHICFPIT